MQLDLPAQPLSLGHVDHARELGPPVERLLTARAHDQPPPLGSELRQVLQEVEARGVEIVQVTQDEKDGLCPGQIGQQPHDGGNEEELISRAVRGRLDLVADAE